MEEAQSEAAKVIIHCHAQRSQMCTREYMPVCGVKEPSVTCKEGQCEEKSVTYPNGCAACADVSVSSYKKGACEDLNVDSNNTK